MACSVNLVLNFALIPEWGIQGASIATFLSYYVCFWVRIIDARYYVPFKFNAVRSLINTTLLFIMAWDIIAAPKLWVLILAGLCAAVIALNYKALLLTANKLLRRN